MRWAFDPEQSAKRCDHIDWFRVLTIGTRLKRSAIKHGRHMSIIVVRSGVVGSRRTADVERSRLTYHIPSSVLTRAVQILLTVWTCWQCAPGELRVRVEVAEKCNLLEGVADQLFSFRFAHFHCVEVVFA